MRWWDSLSDDGVAAAAVDDVGAAAVAADVAEVGWEGGAELVELEG